MADLLLVTLPAMVGWIIEVREVAPINVECRGRIVRVGRTAADVVFRGKVVAWTVDGADVTRRRLVVHFFDRVVEALHFSLSGGERVRPYTFDLTNPEVVRYDRIVGGHASNPADLGLDDFEFSLDQSMSGFQCDVCQSMMMWGTALFQACEACGAGGADSRHCLGEGPVERPAKMRAKCSLRMQVSEGELSDGQQQPFAESGASEDGVEPARTTLGAHRSDGAGSDGAWTDADAEDLTEAAQPRRSSAPSTSGGARTSGAAKLTRSLATPSVLALEGDAPEGVFVVRAHSTEAATREQLERDTRTVVCAVTAAGAGRFSSAPLDSHQRIQWGRRSTPQPPSSLHSERGAHGRCDGEAEFRRRIQHAVSLRTGERRRRRHLQLQDTRARLRRRACGPG